jgi:hypothetical protein
MISAEPENMPEEVIFEQAVEIGPGDKVENWLKEIETTMVDSLRVIAIKCYHAYPEAVADRYDWIFGPWPA